MEQAEHKGKWLRRREILWPTWRTWLALGLLVLAFAITGGLVVHPFLSVTHPVPGGLLVVEGWVPDYALRQAAEEYRTNDYKRVVVTGGPLERGSALAHLGSYAELGAEVLGRYGLSTNDVVPVPAPKTWRNRTYQSALAFAEWKSQHYPEEPVHVYTVGAHARRSWILFEAALGETNRVGVTAVGEQEYPPERWWATSAGVKAVLGETLSYIYIKLLGV